MPKDARAANEFLTRYQLYSNEAREDLGKVLADNRRQDRGEWVRVIREDITNRLTATDRESWADALRCVLTFPCLQLPKPALDPRAVEAAKEYHSRVGTHPGNDAFLAEIIDRHFAKEAPKPELGLCGVRGGASGLSCVKEKGHERHEDGMEI